MSREITAVFENTAAKDYLSIGGSPHQMHSRIHEIACRLSLPDSVRVIYRITHIPAC